MECYEDGWYYVETPNYKFWVKLAIRNDIFLLEEIDTERDNKLKYFGPSYYGVDGRKISPDSFSLRHIVRKCSEEEISDIFTRVALYML